MSPIRGEWTGSDEERNQRIWEDYCSGWKQWQLAKEWNLSEARISQIISSVREALPKTTREDLIRRESAFLDQVRQRAIQLTEQMPAPVTAGKDGLVVRDPETGEIVRDYTGVMAGFKLALDAHSRFARMLGLDQPGEINVRMTQEEERAATDAATQAATRLMTEE